MTSDKKVPYGKIVNASQLGALVRAVRKRSGVTQRDAADLAGVGVRFLSELERGKSTAELGLVLQVLERFGIELWLMPRGLRPEDVLERLAPATHHSDDHAD